MKAETEERRMVFLKVYYISAGQTSLLQVKKAGLASRNIVHFHKNILRCVGFCLHILNYSEASPSLPFVPVLIHFDGSMTHVQCCLSASKFNQSTILGLAGLKNSQTF